MKFEQRRYAFTAAANNVHRSSFFFKKKTANRAVKDTSLCILFSEGNQHIRMPRCITTGISLKMRGVVTCNNEQKK
jgi:hypothetical protein